MAGRSERPGIGSGADAFVARFADDEIGLEDDVTVGEFYAQRTLLKREVLPSHVANAVFVLASSELSHTTGLHIPVDAGVAAAFLR